MKLQTCSTCGEFFYISDINCPHCEIPRKGSVSSSSSYKTFTRSALLLGLALTGCGDKTEDTAKDTASEPTAEPTSEPAVEPPYGVPDTGDTEDNET